MCIRDSKKTAFVSPLGALAHGLKATALLKNRFLFVVEPISKTLFVAVIFILVCASFECAISVVSKLLCSIFNFDSFSKH